MVNETKHIGFSIPDGALTLKTVLTVKNKDALRNMKKTGRNLASRGILPNTSGSMSVKLEDGFLVTISDCEFSLISDNSFVLIEEFDSKNLILKKAHGLSDPSQETPIHSILYSNCSNLSAVVISHDPKLTNEKTISKLKIPTIDVAPGTDDFPEALCKNLGPLGVVIVKGIGMVLAGKTIEDCEERIVTLKRRAP